MLSDLVNNGILHECVVGQMYPKSVRVRCTFRWIVWYLHLLLVTSLVNKFIFNNWWYFDFHQIASFCALSISWIKTPLKYLYRVHDMWEMVYVYFGYSTSNGIFKYTPTKCQRAMVCVRAFDQRLASILWYLGDRHIDSKQVIGLL